MRLTKAKTVGFTMLLLSISLLLCFIVKLPNVRKEDKYKNDFLGVPYGANNLFNVTLQPGGKMDYHVEAAIDPVKGPIKIDLWVVNSTWLGPFLSFMEWVFFEYGHTFRDAYPDRYPFNMIPTNIKEINITKSKRIELMGVNHDDIYCFIFVNFYLDEQYVSINVEERYVDPNIPYRSILEPNLVNFSITIAIASVGSYSLVTDSRKRIKRKYKRLII